ncbi:MAG: SIR2 family protein [Candidatus Electrothrix sp. ATG1]|nr:SIR2 family protein [Candidatus Electrothrix sp. ATG1]
MVIDIGVQEKSQLDSWQQAIVEELRSKKVLPVVSNRLHNDLLLGGHDQLVRSYAKYVRYPFDCRMKLYEITQYCMIMEKQGKSRPERIVKRRYLDAVKKILLAFTQMNDSAGTRESLLEEELAQFNEHDFSTMAADLDYLSLTEDKQNPLLILADFNLPVYLTTSYHCFLEQALMKLGKKPHTAVCCWNDQITPSAKENDLFAQDYQPDPMNPLVYHLYGLDRYPESLVLTEDDYFTFLVNTSRDRDRIANCINAPLNNYSLMLFGYDLADWDFRILLQGLIKNRSFPSQSVCALQLQPSEEEKIYLDRYMKEVDFKVFWGDFGEYLLQINTVT